MLLLEQISNNAYTILLASTNKTHGFELELDQN
jgi:hypothetical protein